MFVNFLVSWLKKMEKVGGKVFEFVSPSPPTVHDKSIGLEEDPTGKASKRLNCRLSPNNMTQS
jgi:hypothetical protein